MVKLISLSLGFIIGGIITYYAFDSNFTLTFGMIVGAVSYKFSSKGE